jgi:hypothetical protein
VNWAKGTCKTSDLGGCDSLLAVSTTGRAYTFLVSTAVQGVSRSQVDNLMHRQIEPALSRWSASTPCTVTPNCGTTR